MFPQLVNPLNCFHFISFELFWSCCSRNIGETVHQNLLLFRVMNRFDSYNQTVSLVVVVIFSRTQIAIAGRHFKLPVGQKSSISETWSKLNCAPMVNLLILVSLFQEHWRDSSSTSGVMCLPFKSCSGQSILVVGSRRDSLAAGAVLWGLRSECIFSPEGFHFRFMTTKTFQIKFAVACGDTQSKELMIRMPGQIPYSAS